MCVVTSGVADLLRVVRSLWAGRNFFLGRKEETRCEPTEQRTLLMTPPVTIVPTDSGSRADAHGHNSRERRLCSFE